MKKFLSTLMMALPCCCFIQTGYAQVSLTLPNVPYSENFNTLASSGTANDVSTLPPGWTFLESGSNANTTYAAGTGSSNAGNTYSLGIDSDRALGGLQSGSLTPLIGASFVNNTGTTITELQIRYTGEQWRLGGSSRTEPDRIDFQYSTNATALSDGTWTDVDALDFSSPILSGSAGALNGNAPENSTVVTFNITSVFIPDGSTFWIRWTDYNVASSDDALSVDDFSLTPVGVPSNQPNIVFIPSSLVFGEINLGTTKTLTYNVIGSNLTDSLIIIKEQSDVFSISLDDSTYTDSLAVADSALVYVKFSPTTNGIEDTTILHTNDTLSKSLSLTASGYDPISNIIPIATARTFGVGTKVTVAGRVTASDQLGSPSYVQDDTGGIPVFDFNFSNNIEIGDSVIVTGPIGVFSNQVQISGSGISFIRPDTTKHILPPKLITIDQLAANEGLLVTVQQVELVNRSFVFYPQSTEQMRDGTIQADLRIDGDTDLPGLTKPQGVVDITGVVGRFQSNAQLLPRFREDVPGAAEPETPADSIPKALTFDLLNWNLEFFGAEREDYPQEFGPADEALQLQNVRDVLLSVQADVIAVQEVANDSLFSELVNQMAGYGSVCSDRYSYSFNGPDSDFPSQKVCFIFNTSTVNVVSYRAMFEVLYDSARLFDPSLLPGYPTGDASSFWSSGRLPFMLTADIAINGATERISFVNLHAKSGSSIGDYNRRVYDAQVLKDSLDTHYANEQVVILGDLNDDLDVSITSGQPTSYEVIVNDTASYYSVTLALSLAGARSTIGFNDMIDHQIITKELLEKYLTGSEQVITPFALIPNYGNTTSDHLPVLSRYAFTPPVIDITIEFAEAEVSREEGSGAYTVRLQLSSPSPTEQMVTIYAANSPGVFYGSFLDYTTDPSLTWWGMMTLTVPAGADEVSFTVTPNSDLFPEPGPEFIVFSIASASEGLTIGEQSTFQFNILNVEPCIPLFFVFPNPTFGTVNIQTLPANEDNIVSGTLFSPNGGLIASMDGTAAQLSAYFTDALQGRKRGVYLLRLVQCGAVVSIRILKL